MRVSVYKEPGFNYLTRTEGLSPTSVGRSGVVLVDLPVMYAYRANREIPGRGVVNLERPVASYIGWETGVVVYACRSVEAT